MNAFPLYRHLCSPLLLACLFAVTASQAEQTLPIPAFKATYTVSRAGITVGKTVLQLEYEAPSRYRIRSNLKTNTLASLIETRNESEEVVGELVDGMPRPLRYHAEKNGSESRTVSMDFDWDRARVTIEVDGERHCLTLGSQTVDPLSLHLLTMLDLQRGRLADAYEVASHNRLKTYQVQPLGETNIEAPIGTLTAQALSRQRPQSRKATIFWHAPEMDFLPVQVSRTKDGKETSRLIIERLKR